MSGPDHDTPYWSQDAAALPKFQNPICGALFSERWCPFPGNSQ